MFGKSARLFAVLFALVLGANVAIAQAPAAKPAPSKTTKTTKTKRSKLVDINSASNDALAALPGIGESYSQKIIAGRPYHSKRDLLTRKILPQATYDSVKGRIVAHRTTAKVKKGTAKGSALVSPK